MSTKEKNTFGILAEFKNPGHLMKAAKLTNKAGFKKFDCYSPFPIHGMDDAMGLKPSKLGYIVMGHGLFGFLGGLALQIWTSTIAYPINISGKPFLNLPAFVPVTFELTILLSAFGAVFGMFFLNNMPRHHNPLFNSERFKKVTDDGFFVVIESGDPLYNEERTRKFLEDAGAVHLELIEE
ncbi:MAG: DUF3341 domain-containing protein [Bacteroidetes bacterium]|nr:DUF3341 domain-containing protein [Bacteroidota bacterium]